MRTERWFTHPRFTLIPAGPLKDVARIFTFGAGKSHVDEARAPDSEVNHLAPDVYTDAAPCINAALRHINAYLQGEDIDDETGLPHLAHAIVRLFIAMVVPKPQWLMRSHRPTQAPRYEPEPEIDET